MNFLTSLPISDRIITRVRTPLKMSVKTGEFEINLPGGDAQPHAEYSTQRNRRHGGDFARRIASYFATFGGVSILGK